MSSEPPKPGAIPGWGQPPDAAPTEPAPAAPTEPAPAAPTAPQAPGTGWGQPPAPSGPPPAAPSGPPPAAPPTPAPQAPPPGGAWGAPPPVAPVAQPGPGAPANWNPQPKPPERSGCFKACLIVGILLVILFVIAIAGLAFLGNQLFKSIPVDENGNLAACPIISNAKLSSTLGENTEAIPLQGLFDATLGLVLDKRVLADAEDCFISSDEGSSGVGRIARYQGGDAAAKFAQEKQKAQPTSQDQGNGVTLENSGYFAGDVPGLGDEAFCTGVSTALMEGVLVRSGNTLVYVSLQSGTIPNFEGTSTGVITSDETCQAAQEVARAILAQ